MAWHEPGKQQQPENPNNRDSNSRRSPDAPPDLDQVLKDLQQKLKNLFGMKKSPGSSIFDQPQKKNPFGNFTVSVGPISVFLAVVLILIWVLSGLFIVEPAEKAAILYFGRYVRTEGPGLHWIPSLIANRYVVNVQQVMTYPYHAEMLTEDENIVLVDLTVQYRIGDLNQFLFNGANPVETLQQATASALRQVVGQTNLDDILTSGREKVRQQTQLILENTLERYQLGLMVTDVNMQPAKPPEEVTSAFDDAIKAREDEKRFINQSKAYANRVVPVAQGQVSRLMAEANAYKQQVVLNAQAATTRFLALLPQYQLAPKVTRERLYIDALQSVLSQSSKILVDSPQGGNNMMVLPLDKLLSRNLESTAIPLSPSQPQEEMPVSVVGKDALPPQITSGGFNNYPSRPVMGSKDNNNVSPTPTPTSTSNTSEGVNTGEENNR